MKHFSRSHVLPLCAVALAFSVGGCSRNVGSEADVAVSQNPESQIPIETTTPATNSASKSQTKSGAEKAKAANQIKPIKWERNFASALKTARATQKPIMIDFYATWCGPCKILDAVIYPAPEVAKEAQNFVSLKVDVDKQQELARQFQVRNLPTILFLDSSGQEIHRTAGIVSDPNQQISSFLQDMQTARAQVAPTAA